MGKLDRFKKKIGNPQVLNRTTPKLAPLNRTTPVDSQRPLNRGMGLENEEIPLSRGQAKGLGVVQKLANPEAIAKFERFNYNPKLNDRSHTMSREMTKAECQIWFNLLDKKQCGGYKFIKQKIVGNYILDFYCSKLLLAIEIDGDTHNVEYDKIRDNFVASTGIKTLRFSNLEVFTNLSAIRQVILENTPFNEANIFETI